MFQLEFQRTSDVAFPRHENLHRLEIQFENKLFPVNCLKVYSELRFLDNSSLSKFTQRKSNIILRETI